MTVAVAVVTGAGGGLGQAIAQRLSADGHVIAALDVSAVDARETCDRIVATGATAKAYVADVRNEAVVAQVVDRIESELGAIAVLVNNAAVFPAGPFLDMTAADYDDTIAVNQRGYFLAAQAVARLMCASGDGGAIVNVGSITQHGGWAEMVAYVSTKGAAAAFTRALATELGPHGIRVNCVAPGAFPTRAEDMHADPGAYADRIIASQALKRRGTNEELAAAVSFLAGPDASFVTGQTLNVDGGWIMA